MSGYVASSVESGVVVVAHYRGAIAHCAHRGDHISRSRLARAGALILPPYNYKHITHYATHQRAAARCRPSLARAQECAARSSSAQRAHTGCAQQRKIKIQKLLRTKNQASARQRPNIRASGSLLGKLKHKLISAHVCSGPERPAPAAPRVRAACRWARRRTPERRNGCASPPQRLCRAGACVPDSALSVL